MSDGSKESKHLQSSKKSSDSIEIPVGKYLSAVRKNPWIVATFVLAVVLIVVVAVASTKGLGSTNDGVAISETEAGNKLVDFVNAQGQGSATLVSSKKEGTLYKVTLNYNNQEVPAYVTLDGQYLIAEPIPLGGGTTTSGTTGTGSADPNPEIVEIKTENSPVLGSKTAQVQILEFSDYQCPFCARHYTETHGQLVTNYITPGKAKIIFHDLPLVQIHPQAQKAAEAARCVKDQKGDTGYFKMHDKLFEGQTTLSIDNFKKWARELGVNGATFDTCLDSGKYASTVSEDASYANSVGVSGTPGFIIVGDSTKIAASDLQAMQVYQQGDYLIRYIQSSDGKLAGVRISGALPYDTFKKVVDAFLA